MILTMDVLLWNGKRKYEEIHFKKALSLPNTRTMYDSVTIESMNHTSTWNRTIQYPENHPKRDTSYRLHATGACTLNGRVYVALPIHVDVSCSEVKKRYNLL